MMAREVSPIIFQLGNDQLTTKATYYPNELKKFKFHTFYFSEDRSGLSLETIEKENLDAIIAPTNLLKRWWLLLLLFIEKRPESVELYLSQRPWHLIYYYFLGRLFGAKIVMMSSLNIVRSGLRLHALLTRCHVSNTAHRQTNPPPHTSNRNHTSDRPLGVSRAPFQQRRSTMGTMTNPFALESCSNSPSSM